MIVQEMTRDENIALVSTHRLGRLACVRDNRPYLVPFHYALSDNHLYSFSMQGQKIDWMRENAQVCVQVDEVGATLEWRSVIVFGLFEELPETPQWQRDRDHAWSLLQKHANWWEPASLKPSAPSTAVGSASVFYRIKIESMTGRHAREATSSD
ncbi:pyridoxamine 5'-phosphate oxidase family protein [Aminobacter carboxidus]|uniref:Pyridoxamine 5'-phosphate oxidase family protein n=1 Tax=Aminobacter carboxidus TaxID=376165 RepID=A0ABR9GP20_9HYPH|nr:pyridoxamine 5'-phosphate oxidase family protein [Aminobacter carboxidus]MBE1205343.1 pyridoxamine 5'-phosphate oxidase family protein [Aminobacter carboxidus]